MEPAHTPKLSHTKAHLVKVLSSDPKSLKFLLQITAGAKELNTSQWQKILQSIDSYTEIFTLYNIHTMKTEEVRAAKDRQDNKHTTDGENVKDNNKNKEKKRNTSKTKTMA